MRAAPPVDAALAGGGTERMLMLLLHGLAGGVMAAWLGLHAGLPPVALTLVIVAAALLLLGLGARLARHVLPIGPDHLRWTGAQWQLITRGVESPLQRTVVALDLGGWMLLRLHMPGERRTGWRVADVRSAQGAWHGLRVALAAHAGAADASLADGAPR